MHLHEDRRQHFRSARKGIDIAIAIAMPYLTHSFTTRSKKPRTTTTHQNLNHAHIHLISDLPYQTQTNPTISPNKIGNKK
ncbi:hypothetical protein PHAVU_002G136500 [Phaseolus vulgaris]|uniref:Uncharacterized protein n=1 Tax=Phaseolus vulgaris TaxID=3885 RepID=V7CMW9_PHAVU|nr:hypothetical protein PHAVU_002G136500g [Phaseolus vulgaris]ESW30241.1 hypothetical protein PHAVU_002G136500g [Phaseolus vulgaris]